MNVNPDKGPLSHEAKFTRKIVVKQNNRKIGTIRHSDGGFKYTPKGTRNGSGVFCSLESLKLWLEMKK